MLYVIPTIDAEGVHGDPPFERMMLGDIGADEPWGIGLQAQIFQQYGARASFFLDVYEYSYFGEEKLRGCVDLLRGHDQDIQLHTHPAWFQDERDSSTVRKMKLDKSCFAPDRYWMHHNSLEDQIKILEHGIELMERWGAGRPVAHRAGAYGMNADTIRALSRVGIPIDASMHHDHPNCELTWSRNQVIDREGVVEIPVTGFQRNRAVTLGPLRWRRPSRFVKTDLDACSLTDLLGFAEAAKRQNLSVMVLFLHSYSLIKFNSHFTRFAPNPANREKLERFLAACREDSEVEFLSMDVLWERYQCDPAPFLGSDEVPVLESDVSLMGSLRKRMRRL